MMQALDNNLVIIPDSRVLSRTWGSMILRVERV
jgi:hypothetical protein